MKKLLIFVISLVIITWASFCFAEDGTYDATVTTDSGSYTAPVEVEGGEVTSVHWPNGGNMSLSGADISDGEADGTSSKGETVHVQIDDYQPEPGSGSDE